MHGITVCYQNFYAVNITILPLILLSELIFKKLHLGHIAVMLTKLSNNYISRTINRRSTSNTTI